MAVPATPLGTDPPFDAALREAHSRLLAVHCAALGTLEAELQRMRNENTLLRMQLTTGISTEAPLKVDPKVVTPVERKAEQLPEQAAPVMPPAVAAATAVASGRVEAVPAEAPSAAAAPPPPPAIVPAPVVQIVKVDQMLAERDLVVEASAPVTFAPGGLTSGPAPRGPSPGAHARPTPPAAAPRGAAPAQDEPATSREGSMGIADEGAASGAASQRMANSLSGGPRLVSSSKKEEATGSSFTAPAGTPQKVEVTVVKVQQEHADSGASTSAAPPVSSNAPLLGPVIAVPVPAPVVGASASAPAAPEATALPPSAPSAAAVVSHGSQPSSSPAAVASTSAPSSAGRLVQPNHHSDSASDLDSTTPRPAPLTPKAEVPVAVVTKAAAAQQPVPEPEKTQEVIEVITPGALQLASNDSSVEQDVDRALEAVLAYHGWQHLDVQKVGKDMWSFSGSLVQIRCEAAPAATGAVGGPPYNLQASADDGRTWEQLEGLIRHRRLHKVVRTAPIASSLDSKRTTQESPPNESSNQVPISLADLARMPSRASPVEGHMVLQGRATPSGRSQRSRENSRERAAPASPRSVYYQQGAATAGARSSSNSYGTSNKHPQLLPIGSDGLPTHRHDGLPNFNNAFPTYFDALSGPTNYYNSFRIAGARGPDPYS